MGEGSSARIGGLSRCLCDAARLAVGMPSYYAYLEHMGRAHPDATPMPYAEFFRDRQDARYGGARRGGFRCCSWLWPAVAGLILVLSSPRVQAASAMQTPIVRPAPDLDDHHQAKDKSHFPEGTRQ
jgi:uncharacterized short protein YbdD (DUF466 family)